MLSANFNSTQPMKLTTTSVSSPSFVDDLTQRAGDLASMGSWSSMATFDSVAAGTSSGMPRMVNCLANSRGRIVSNSINRLCTPSTSVVWSCQNIRLPQTVPLPPCHLVWTLSPALTSTPCHLCLVRPFPRSLWVPATPPFLQKLCMQLSRESTLTSAIFLRNIQGRQTISTSNSFC